MAKVLCIIAWAGLVTAAPYSVGRRVPEEGDTNLIVEKVLTSLDLPIENAIEQALSMLYGSSSPSTQFSATLTQGPQYTVETTGSVSGENFQGQFSGTSSQSESSSTFNSVTGGAASTSGSTSTSGSDSSSIDATSVVNRVAQLLGPQIEETVQKALNALTTTTTVAVAQPEVSQINTVDLSSNSFESSNQQSSEFNSFSSTGKAATTQNKAAVVSQIISALTPQITESVTLALAGQSQTVSSESTEQQQSFSSSQSSSSSSSDFVIFVWQ
jgi:hypothetical protein